MGVDFGLLQAECERTLRRTELRGARRRIEGKVRDSYLLDGKRAIVVTDRVSAFDVVLGTIPFKGQVLNQLAAFWFQKMSDVAPNHLLAVPDPCVSVVREVQVLPIEFVYRGYLTGVSKTSIWTAYERGERLYCGHRLPDGLRKHERFAAPLLTPTTKAEHGAHDELTSREELIRSGVICDELYDRAADLGLKLFQAGTAWAASRGLILVDTKYEMGLTPDGELLVVDEIHTPDSSRYWYSHTYERALADGGDPQSLDKEYVRRWLVEQGYRGEGAPPALPDEVRCEAARRYIETFELLTAQSFEPVSGDPLPRIQANLAGYLAPF
jgi:phosphoribosylaminoimidazole-succinocarboxamide synthase